MEQFCTQCGSRLPDGAKYCPSCGAPVQVFSPTPPPTPTIPPDPPVTAIQERKVGFLLGLGILLLPLVFPWFTLRKGYSAMARTLSFGYLAIFLFVFGFAEKEHITNSPAFSIFSDTSRQEIDKNFVNLFSVFSDISRQGIDKNMVHLKDMSWEKKELGSDMIVSFTIDNRNGKPIKEIEITCTHYGNIGTRIDSNTRTIYEVIRGYEIKKFKGFNMGKIHSQGVRTLCGVTDVKKGE